MPAGRPTDYDFDLVKGICTRLSEGEQLKDILSEEGMPARSSFFLWKREHKQFSDLYVNVQQDKGELFIEEIDDTVNLLRQGKMDPSTANVIIQALKWKASKFYPKMFGDKTDITSQGEKIQSAPIMFIPAENLTPEQIEKYLNNEAGPSDQSIH